LVIRKRTDATTVVENFALEINSVNDSDARNGSIGSFRVNHALVVDCAIKQASCGIVQNTVNASSL